MLHLQRNQVLLEGVIVEADALRYTPGGVPHLELKLRHESKQEEAGAARDVALVMSAIAMGKPALMAATFQTGQLVAIKGFLSRRSLKSDYPVLHIDQIKSL